MTDSSLRGNRLIRATSILLSIFLFATVFASQASASTTGTDPADGAAIAELPDDTLVFHVDASAPLIAATDGSAEHPLPSLAWGMIFADYYRENGSAVRLVVAPGTYRETLTIGWAGDEPQPLVIESEVPGAAIVTGADLATAVTDLGSGLASVPWANDWGLSPVPSGWSSVNVPEGIRRREAVLVDGQPLVQVLSEAAVVPGSFYADEVGDRLVIGKPDGVVDLGQHVVEVSQRQRTLQIQGRARSVAIDGMVFEAGAPRLGQAMAYVSDSSEVLLEGNTFRHSSWTGLGVCCTHGVTIRDNTVHDNGGNGVDTYKTHDLVVEDNVVNANNVRGGRHGYVGWSVAGAKNLLLRGAVFRNNTFKDNHTRGLWFDTDVADVLVDRVVSCNNRTDGMFIEAVQGPLTVQNSTFCDNGRAGILTGTSRGITVRGSTFTNNSYGQLVFAGDRSRSWIDHVTGLLIQVPDFEDWSLVENTFRSDGASRLIYSPNIPIDDWRRHLGNGEITASRNTWTHPDMSKANQINGHAFSMAEWSDLTGDTAPVVEKPQRRKTAREQWIERWLQRWFLRAGWGR